MVLSDHDIKQQLLAGRIRIEPLDPDDIQPSSVDVHLADRFQVFRNSRYPYIDPMIEQQGLMELVQASSEAPFVLHPGEFVLGATIERLVLPATSSRGSRARARWDGSVCSSTRPQGTSIRAGTVR